MFSSFVKILVIVLYFAHTTACLFWLVGTTSLETSDYSWIVKQQMGLLDADITEQYVNCLYWACTTMITIGYGDISAQNTSERLYSMFAMLVMAGVYAFTLSTVSKRVQEYYRLEGNIQENKVFVKQWMESHCLSKELRCRIMGYL